MRTFIRCCPTLWRGTMARTTPSSRLAVALMTSLRTKSFHFYLNLQDPEDTRRYVEEELERLSDNHKRDTAGYLHSLLNLSLSYYQAEDYIKAREFAEYTHQRAHAYNSKSSLLFLTATTCAKCCTQLADEYEAHVAAAEARAHTSVTLAPRPSVVFSAKRAIRKLREDATRYEGIATRIEARPDMAFMKGTYNPSVNPKRRQAYYGEDKDGEKAGESETDGHTSTSKEAGGGEDANTHNSSSSARRQDPSPGMDARVQRSHHRRGMGWQEDACHVDEEFDDQYFGERWQKKRRRPEHAELKRYYQRQNISRNGGRFKVPK